MGLNHRSPALCDHEQRAALREDVLRYGRLLGWSAHTTIALTERLTRRSWKRCPAVELAVVLDELHSIVAAFQVRARLPLLPDPDAYTLAEEEFLAHRP